MRRTLAAWPLLIALAVLAASLALLAERSLRVTEGQLTYALDDPYIHMAVAKNLVGNGTWGVSAHEFSSSSSSPLWTLLLAGGFAIAGLRTSLPFVLDVALAALVLVIAHAGLRRRGVPNAIVLPALLALIAFVPLPTLVFLGLEHVAHLALTLMFLFALADLLDAPAGPHSLRTLLVLSALLPGVRYEALFTVGAGALVLAFAGRRGAAVSIVAAAAAVPLLFGLYSLAHGSGLLPNSLLLKGNAPHLGSLRALLAAAGGDALRKLRAAPHLELLLLELTAAAAWLWVARPRRLDGAIGMPVVVIVATLGHLQFAQTGWFFRYEAYLVGAALVALAAALPALDALPGALSTRAAPRRALLVAALLLLAPSLGVRAASAFHQTPRATRNIHGQQVQMGRFAKLACAGQGVALDDIGAVSWLADIHCADLIGLADLQALRATRSGHYDSTQVKRIVAAHEARTAIVYDAWFARYIEGGVPSGWTRVGVWSIGDHINVFSDSVSIYAIHPEDAPALIGKLREFAPRLPAGVRQSGAYLRAGS